MIAVPQRAQPFMRLLYDGKYDSGIFLLQILSLAGLLRLINGLSSSFIMAVLPTEVWLFIWQSPDHYAFLLPGLYFALRGLGVIGAGYALAVQLAIRVAVGYFLIVIGGGRQKPWLRR
jgi:O-antigen/teichoic acid export membrane protein